MYQIILNLKMKKKFVTMKNQFKNLIKFKMIVLNKKNKKCTYKIRSQMNYLNLILIK